jgi:hypothetical protein
MSSADLEQQGWTHRFTTIGVRLSEAVDLYLQLGFEVHLEPAEQTSEPSESVACRYCFVTTRAQTIYTRPKSSSSRWSSES